MTFRPPPEPSLLLMAAGRSSRYGRPKQLDPLGPSGASLTVYTVLDGLRAGFGRVVLVTDPELRGPLEAHLEAHLGRGLPLSWAHQETGDVPERLRSAAADREKPWGTAHAVLSARERVPGPFGVANADDWYGPEALRSLADATGPLERRTPCSAVLVGFPMEDTLPPDGSGVSRGWVREAEGVTRVLELRDVRSDAGAAEAGARDLIGTDPDGRARSVPATATASMNLWGFASCTLALLGRAFRSFLEERGTDPDAEFALSTAVDGLVRQGRLQLEVVPGGRRWFGVTHPGDAPWVRDRLQALHEDGTYALPLTELVP